MDKPPAIGFLGFGEAGFHIAKGLRSAGVTDIAAYDIHVNTPGRGEIIQSRAFQTGTALTASERSTRATLRHSSVRRDGQPGGDCR